MRISEFVKKPIIIAALIIALILGGLMLYSYSSAGDMTVFQNVTGTVFAPFRKVGTAIGNFFSYNYGRLTGYDELVEENNNLRSQLSKAEFKLRQNESLAKENEDLKKYLGLKDMHDDYELVYANVTGRGVGNSDKVLIIDAGKRDGLTQGQIVMTNDGVVGVVSDVGTAFAEVTTVLDTDISIGAMIVRTHDIAILEGSTRYQGEGKCVLSLLPNANSAQTGDTVQTSGLGHTYPKGLIIGTVDEVFSDEYSNSVTAVIKPVVDFDEVTSVMVITSFGGDR